MLVCNYCNTINVQHHSIYTEMCIDCGKLYSRFIKAKQRQSASALRNAKQDLMCRWVTHKGERYDEVKMTEVPMIKEETHKYCKQCGRKLPVDNFRKYVPRGAGKRATTQGYHTICKDCESMSNRVAYALRQDNTEMLEAMKKHYQLLIDRGLPPVTAAPKRLMGLSDTVADKRSISSLSEIICSESELEKHCRLVATRGYASVDEADKEHARLREQYGDTEEFGEAGNQLEDWFIEGGE